MQEKIKKNKRKKIKEVKKTTLYRGDQIDRGLAFLNGITLLTL